MFVTHIYLWGRKGHNLLSDEVDPINQPKYVEACSTSTNEGECDRKLLSLPWHHET